MNKITNLKKESITLALKEYCERYGSQNKAARSLNDVSSATISQILGGHWELIRDEMWRNIGSQVGVKMKDWQQVETTDYRLMVNILDDARDNSLVMAVIGQAGSGKSFAVDHYKMNHPNTFVLKCNSFWNKKMFLSEILKELGCEYRGLTEGEMMYACINNLIKLESPLLVFDEADKLSDASLYLFISLYNAVEDDCGILLCATKHLEKSLLRGVALNKKGYNEIWSRVGRKCIQLKGVTSADIVEICEANGITDSQTVEKIINDSESDLRRVKRMIFAVKKQRTARLDKARTGF